MPRFYDKGDRLSPSVQERNCARCSISMWKINSSRPGCKSQASSITWDYVPLWASQAGRFAPFHQIGVECFGSNLIQLPMWKLSLWQLISWRNRHPRCQIAPQYSWKSWEPCGLSSSFDWLFDTAQETLSKDSQRRLEENPRVLDSEEKKTKVAVENAPSILDWWRKAKSSFWCCASDVWKILMNFIIDTIWCVVWTTTITLFSSLSHRLRAMTWQSIAGGRYDGLVFTLVDQKPLAGFGLGVGKRRYILEKQRCDPP